MTENKFKQGQYEDALQFTKDILINSYTVSDILTNSQNIKDIKDSVKIDLKNKDKI